MQQTSQRSTVEAMLPTVKIEFDAVDHGVCLELAPALRALLHDRTLVLSAARVNDVRHDMMRPPIVSAASAPRGGFEPPTY